MIGQTIGGRYRIEAELGRGAMGIVYLATDLKYGRKVAIKTMFATLATDPEFIARFHREAQALSQLEHPNVVRLYKWFRDGENYYMVIEYVDGMSLARYLEGRRPLPIATALKWFYEVAAGLGHAHSRGIIHRDVTAGNILISSAGQAKVSDFGIARLAKVTLYRKTNTLGTPLTVSPEVIKNQPATERSDVYSLSVVLFQMLTGRPPFYAEEPYALLNMHLQQPPPSARKINPAVSPALDRCISKALAKDPAQRYPGVQAFAEAVRAATTSGAVSTAAGPRATSDRSGIHFSWLSLVVGLLLVVLAVLLLTMIPRWLENGAQPGPSPARTRTVVIAPSTTPMYPTTTPVRPATATVVPATAAIAVTQPPTPTAPTAAPAASPTLAPTPSQPMVVRAALLAFTVTDRFREIYHIELMNSDGSNRRMLVNLASEPAFSPDGRQLVYYGWPGGLHIINADGTGDRSVVNDAEAAFPAWSPDGRFIAFHSSRGGSSRWDVYVVNADGTGERMVVDGEQATWSPGSNQLVYKGCLGSNCGLMVVNLDGSGKRRLTTCGNCANDGLADWSRDTNRIVFTSERDGNHEIYVMNADGSGQQRLTDHPAPDALPVWLPGGQQIAFRSARDGVWAIYIMNADGGGLHKVADAKVDPNRWIWEKMAATRR